MKQFMVPKVDGRHWVHPTCSQGTPNVCGHAHCCVWHTRCTDRLLPQADPLLHNKPGTSVFINVDCVWIWHEACSKNMVQSLGSGLAHRENLRHINAKMWAACIGRWRFLGVERCKDSLQRVQESPTTAVTSFHAFLKRACNCWNKGVAIICSSAGNS